MNAVIFSPDASVVETFNSMAEGLFKELKLETVVSEPDLLSKVLSGQSYQLFIVDCTACDPNSISEKIIDLMGLRPIIFMGPEKDLKEKISEETMKAHNLNSKLSLPLDVNSFRECIGPIINSLTEESSAGAILEIDSSQYIGMKIKNFKLSNKMPFDAFVEVTSNKYMKVVTRDCQYNQSMISSYLKKGMKYFYIEKTAKVEYLQSELKRCKKWIEDNGVKNPDIFMTLIKTISVYHEYVNEVGVTDDILDLSRSLPKTITDLAMSYFNVYELINRYPKHLEGIPSKSLLSALLMIQTGIKFGWTSDNTFHKLALAAIIQDISVEDDEISYLLFTDEPLTKMFSAEKKESFFEHPFQSAEVAKNFSWHPDIDNLILLHHELPTGKGFPSKLGSLNLTTINGVFNISCFLATRLDGSEVNYDMLKQTIDEAEYHYNMGSFKDVIGKIKVLFKFQRVA
jgi:hypothetical protein